MTVTVPLIDPPTRSMTLKDGRLLTWQEFGAPDGRPVMYFHGGGSFSLEAGLFHREAVERNIRLIAANRPGAGGSTVRPGRPVAAYSNDLSELLDLLGIDRFACLGESNGGMIALAVAGTMSARVLGAIPINPTLPWFDPLARRVSPGLAAIAYRLMKYLPGLLTMLASTSTEKLRRKKLMRNNTLQAFDPIDLLGPPPGIEADVGDLQWRVMEQGGADKHALLADVRWTSSDWGFDYYSISSRMDFFCGAYDPQAPFALVLAERNPNASFHYFSYGHYAYSHPDARRRIFDTVSGYFGS